MKYALVTGGSRGIGRAVCVKLAQMGYHIIINHVSNATEAQKTLELVRQAGQDGEILMFDVSNRQQTSKASSHGRTPILKNTSKYWLTMPAYAVTTS